MDHTANHTPSRINGDTPSVISRRIARICLLDMKRDGYFSSYTSEGYHELGRGSGKTPPKLWGGAANEGNSLPRLQPEHVE